MDIISRRVLKILEGIDVRVYITNHAEFDYFHVPSTIFQLCRGGSSLVEPVLS